MFYQPEHKVLLTPRPRYADDQPPAEGFCLPAMVVVDLAGCSRALVVTACRTRKLKAVHTGGAGPGSGYRIDVEAGRQWAREFRARHPHGGHDV